MHTYTHTYIHLHTNTCIVSMSSTPGLHGGARQPDSLASASVRIQPLRGMSYQGIPEMASPDLQGIVYLDDLSCQFCLVACLPGCLRYLTAAVVAVVVHRGFTKSRTDHTVVVIGVATRQWPRKPHSSLNGNDRLSRTLVISSLFSCASLTFYLAPAPRLCIGNEVSLAHSMPG